MCILNVKDHKTSRGNSLHKFSSNITDCLGKTKQKECRKSQQRNVFWVFFFWCKMKAFHHDVLPRFVLSISQSPSLYFPNSVKCLAIDFETCIFSHNSYSEPVCLMSANLPISHFPTAFPFGFALLCKCSSKLHGPLTLALEWFGLQV